MHLFSSETFDFLESKYHQYNNVSFIEKDPIFIPHQFSKKEDIEIAAFLTSTIAWGQRKTILNNSIKLLELMDHTPFEFVTSFTQQDLKKFNNFTHRTFNGIDCSCFLLSLQQIYLKHEGLESVFTQSLNVSNCSIANQISNFRKTFFQLSHSSRTLKHISDPLKNSSAKRICMFLRWMVRKDQNGVDFGIWNSIPTSCLAIPLDVHSSRIARNLSLLSRTQNDWKAVMELTEALKLYDFNDPVKYDFALFGTGVNEKF